VKEIHAAQAAEQRARLAELRDTVARIRGDKQAAAAEVRAGCQLARKALPGRLRAYREAEKARLRRELAEARQAARNRCQAAKVRIQATAGSAIEAARLALAEERKTQRIIREAERKITRRARTATSASERRAESDDEVRRNIPDELVPIFDRVRKTIAGGPRRTRTEAFLEWAEENTGVVTDMRAELAEAAFARELAKHHREERERHQATRRARPTRAELAAVPF